MTAGGRCQPGVTFDWLLLELFTSSNLISPKMIRLQTGFHYQSSYFANPISTFSARIELFKNKGLTSLPEVTSSNAVLYASEKHRVHCWTVIHHRGICCAEWREHFSEKEQSFLHHEGSDPLSLDHCHQPEHQGFQKCWGCQTNHRPGRRDTRSTLRSNACLIWNNCPAVCFHLVVKCYITPFLLWRSF